MRYWIAMGAGLGLLLGGAGRRDLDATFRDVINARNDAMARGDTAAVHRGITDDMVWVIGATGVPVTAPVLLSLLAHVQNPRPQWSIDSVHARDLGGVATVTYRRLDRRRVGDYEGASWTRALEVYVMRDHRWRLVQHSQTWIVSAPDSIAADSAALSAFVGHYEIGPGYVDNVHWESGHLVATASGQTVGGTLIPVSGSAFSPDGIAPLMVFERDASGRVVGYVQGNPDGHVLRARKID
jgi:Domain of unknown function (DUF4440)